MPKTKTASLLPYDPQCRCPVCGCLFGEGEWQLAYVGTMVAFTEDGVTRKANGEHVVVHDDCFIAVWSTKKPEGARPRGLLPCQPGGGI
jgi:hypothetical protein